MRLVAIRLELILTYMIWLISLTVLKVCPLNHWGIVFEDNIENLVLFKIKYTLYSLYLGC